MNSLEESNSALNEFRSVCDGVFSPGGHHALVFMSDFLCSAGTKRRVNLKHELRKIV
jgi:hypothetical protein